MLALRNLFGARITIIGRTTLEDIGDINLLSLITYCQQHIIKKLACPAYKGLSLAIFISTRRFSYDHDPCILTTDTKDSIVA